MKKTLLIIFFLFCLSAFSLDIEGIKFSDTIKTVIKGKEMGTIEGRDFSKLLFSVWLGENSLNKELKNGLLGK